MTSSLPHDFLWGTSNAAYQIEGAWNVDGKVPSVWDTAFNAGRLRVPDGSDLGVAADEYHHLDEDLDLLGELGAQAHRFSISWPRVITDAAGTVNQAGLDYYDRLVDGLLERGIKPAACLYHWDTPQWLEDRCGGWMGRESAAQFARFTRIMAERLGDRVDQWYTMNEPSHPALAGYIAGFFPPLRREGARGLDAVHNILLAHGLSVRALREAHVTGRIGTILAVTGVQPATGNPQDVKAAATARESFDRLMLDPLMGHGYTPAVREQIESDGTCHDGDMAAIAEPMDVLGVNWYSSTHATTEERAPMFLEGRASNTAALRGLSSLFGAGHGVAIVPAPGRRWWSAKGFRQETPGGLRKTVEWVHATYPNHPPIIITENGRGMAHPSVDGHTEDDAQLAACVHDDVRIRALSANIRDLNTLAAEGIPVRGYYIWSSIDNIQWTNGFSERFGLVHVDTATMRRTRKDSFAWFQDVVRHNGDLDNLDKPVPEERFDGDVNGVDIAGVPNARGIGGLRTIDGRHLRGGMFLRSAGLNFMTPGKGPDDLHRLGIRTVVDLRDEWETKAWPYELDGTIEVVRYPLLGQDNGDARQPASRRAVADPSSVNLPDLYHEIAFGHADRITTILHMLARDEHRPMLIHCTAGKDRTGVVTAILLGLLDVEDGLVTANYARSAANLTEMFKRTIMNGLPADAAKLAGSIGKDGNPQGAAAALLASPAPVMQRLIDDIRTEYGTIPRYCLANGLSEDDIDQLRALFID
ncbi:family 1 glycosylhydrolase [Bifidobacterium sp. SO4]|uniref:family 1 glycosylhydrolase n=1 Tax=Bifidobacterium sp. SO4 TaxID=2809030 RepID=UPI001BDDADD3|nr:family 1 glycosylhydrolase [Bifidobacterium sp. SO4]MBT1170635.1 family 1 glycosylhydrolase [Bifidobacterium sp. SO4]